MALDPGKTTGIAIWDRGDVTTSQIQVEDIWGWLDEMVNPKVRVVYESYILRPQMARLSRETDALEIIGAVKLLAATRNVVAVAQSPADAKTFMHNKKLREQGLWKISIGRHALDALRHLGLYLLRCGIAGPGNDDPSRRQKTNLAS